MNPLLISHQHAPVIWDWCPVCKLYISHDNGFVGPASDKTAATSCRRCHVLLLWP